MKDKIASWLYTLKAFDIRVNEFFGGNKGETISSRWGRYIRDDTNPIRAWAARVVCRTILLPLGWILDNHWKHCVKSINQKYKSK